MFYASRPIMAFRCVYKANALRCRGDALLISLLCARFSKDPLRVLAGKDHAGQTVFAPNPSHHFSLDRLASDGRRYAEPAKSESRILPLSLDFLNLGDLHNFAMHWKYLCY